MSWGYDTKATALTMQGPADISDIKYELSSSIIGWGGIVIVSQIPLQVFNSIILFYYSIILSIPHEDIYETVIIPGHAVFDVINEELPANVIPPQKKECQTDSKDDIMKKKNKLMAWFKTNLLPVTESEDKIVIGNVTLLSPYNISDLCTDNPIVAMQIKNVIEKMPENFEPK